MKIEQQKQDYLSKSKFFKALAKDYKQRLDCVNKVANTGMQANGKLRQKETLHLIAGVLGVVGIVAGVVTLNVPVIVLSAGCSIINGAMYADNQKSIKNINGTLAEYEVSKEVFDKVKFGMWAKVKYVVNQFNDRLSIKPESFQLIDKKPIQTKF